MVVRLVDQGESDRRVLLFTRLLGPLWVTARAARASRRRFGGVLLLGQRIGAILRSARGSRTLESGSLRDAHTGLSADLPRLEELGIVLALVRDLLPEEVPEPELFDAVLGHLATTAREGPDRRRLAALRLRLADRLGFGPELGACVGCGREVPPARKAGFDPARGGVVCRACGGGSVTLSVEALALASAVRAGAEDLAAFDVASGGELDRALADLLHAHGSKRRD